MEILQVVTGPLAARLLGQHLPMIAVLAAAVDVRQVLEEKARAIEQERPRTVVVRGQGIDAGLHIGEIPPEQRGHIGIEAVASRHRGIGASRQARGPPPRSRTAADNRRMNSPWPMYQATRGNCVAP